MDIHIQIYPYIVIHINFHNIYISDSVQVHSRKHDSVVIQCWASACNKIFCFVQFPIQRFSQIKLKLAACALVRRANWHCQGTPAVQRYSQRSTTTFYMTHTAGTKQRECFQFCSGSLNEAWFSCHPMLSKCIQ